jgi:hypothetical protein
MGQSTGVPTNTVRLSPRVRSELLENGAIASIPLHLIGPFLNEAVVFDTNQLDSAPRIVATQEGRVMLSRGETAYVRGELGGVRDFRLFRQPVPLLDPITREVLGYEARFVGTAENTRPGEERVGANGKPEIVPATFVVSSTRVEAAVGDRLAPVPQRDLSGVCAARAGAAGRRAHRLDLRRGDHRRPEPDRRAEPRPARRHGARPRAGAVARRLASLRPHRRPAHADRAARRKARPAVRLQRVRARVLCADRLGAAAGAAR